MGLQEYTGNAVHQAIQKRLHDRTNEFAQNPLISNGGRILNILDPEAFGWDNVMAEAARDGFVSLTAVPREKTRHHLRTTFGDRFHLMEWGVFLGDAKDLFPICSEIVKAMPLPDGWRLANETRPTDSEIAEVQKLNAATGVAPTPAYYMRGEMIPHLTTCLWDDREGLAACATATDRYHPASRLAGSAFAGSVSVSPVHRRKGLGALAMAALIRDTIVHFGSRSVLAQAKPDNAASVGMLTRCGLLHRPDLATLAIVTVDDDVTR